MNSEQPTGAPGEGARRDSETNTLIHQAVEQALSAFLDRQKPAEDPGEAMLRQDLSQERKKREHLEKRVNELVEESRKAREAAEQADRFAAIKSELQQLGVAKVDLAFRAVREDVKRGEDGKLYAQTEDGSVAVREYLSSWVAANPEFRPARISGGTGASASRGGAPQGSTFDLDRIKPGMSAEDRERARQEVARVAAQALGGVL